MTDQEYKEMIHNIIVPATLSIEEREKQYQPLSNFLLTKTPEKLYRFRRCDELSISAFEQDQIWFSPGYKMNDDFDALLYFDETRIKEDLKSFWNSSKFRESLDLLKQGIGIPTIIKDMIPPSILADFLEKLKQTNTSSLEEALQQIHEQITKELEQTSSDISQLLQKSLKFASFSEEIYSAAMWGYYADSSQGFALAYDFRNRNYSICNTCKNNSRCPVVKSCTLFPMIYDDVRFDATQYATWLFQEELLKRILAEQNLLSFFASFQDLFPCPDLFMSTKVLLHKANAWKHEKEWRLIYSCISSEFNQQEFSCVTKRPSAVYLGRRISPLYEKILRHIAVEKKIPVYKMELFKDDISYRLYPGLS